MSLKTVHRLRLPNGRNVETQNDFSDYIEKVLLKSRPMTPKEISIALQKSTKQIQRYLYPLKEIKKIVKIEGSDKYKLVHDSTTKSQTEFQKHLETMSEYMKTETITRWLENNKSKKILDAVVSFGRICTGQTIKGLKIHPDFYIHPDTTKLIIKELSEKKYSGKQIPRSLRMAIRSFLIYGKELKLSQAESDRLGISGEKEKPKASTLELEKNQYDKCIEILQGYEQIDCNNRGLSQSYDIANGRYFLKFGFRFWTFGRPSTMYIVRCNQLVFYDRTVNYIEVNNEKITDKRIVEALKDDYKIKTLTHRACHIPDYFEFKTETSYPKYIYDERIVIPLEAYTKERISKGFKYLFWDNSKTEFTKENYDTIVANERGKDNSVFHSLLVKVGIKPDAMTGQFRANYALRHFGVQYWLQIPSIDYNYGFIAEMGWEDINTLKIWYGKRTRKAMERKMSEVIV